MSHPAKRNIGITKPFSYSVIILAAGTHLYMKSYGPTSLLKLNHKKTILDHQLSIIKHLPQSCLESIVLVVGSSANKVMNSTPDSIVKIENENHSNTNATRSLGMALRAIHTPTVIVLHGDLVFNKYIFSSLKLSHLQTSSVVLDTNFTMKSKEVGCTTVNQFVERFDYTLPKKWAQVAILTGKELELCKKICWNEQYYNYFLFESFNEILNMGGKLKTLSPYLLKVTDIDSSKDLTFARTII